MKKNIVLDPDILLDDPNALATFKDDNVIIPIDHTEEIDGHKNLHALCQKVRQALQEVTVLRLVDDNLNNDTENGILQSSIDKTEPSSESVVSDRDVDKSILAVAMELHEADPETPLLIISKDIKQHIRAAAVGLEVQMML